MGTRVKTQIKNAARKGKPISPGEAARRVNKQVDANIRAGKARGAGGAVNIPARPFVMFQEEDVDAVHEVFDKWLAQEMAKAGFIE
jgi:phage gpG-like protein